MKWWPVLLVALLLLAACSQATPPSTMSKEAEAKMEKSLAFVQQVGEESLTSQGLTPEEGRALDLANAYMQKVFFEHGRYALNLGGLASGCYRKARYDGDGKWMVLLYSDISYIGRCGLKPGSFAFPGFVFEVNSQSGKVKGPIDMSYEELRLLFYPNLK